MTMINYIRTFLLLAVLAALFAGAGYLVGGEQGMIIALLIAGAMNIFAYWNADKLVLSMYRAREVGPAEAPNFYAIVERLARRAGMPMPRVYIIDNDQPNAFATGRDPEHAAVAATTGLLRMLSSEEIAGVMAHELAHVRNRDTLIMTITATIAGAISMLANFAMFLGFFGGNNREGGSPFGIIGALLVMFLAPVAAMIVQMAISRGREYEADRIGAEICGNPLWLASALEKLARGAELIDNEQAEANPATAHLFIVNPLHGARAEGGHATDSLFSTHPNTANRIARLREMAREQGLISGPWG